MSYLNEKNKKTEKIIHIMITTLCQRDCKFCCNKQYNLNDIPYVTDEELKNANTICLTGGEPFLFCNPCEVAKHYKRQYKNIKNIYVYTNALELSTWLKDNGDLYSIDGVNVSIKTPMDAITFKKNIKDNESVKKLSSNLLYVFDNLYDGDAESFKVLQRQWQEDFEPADDSIFRKA